MSFRVSKEELALRRLAGVCITCGNEQVMTHGFNSCMRTLVETATVSADDVKAAYQWADDIFCTASPEWIQEFMRLSRLRFSRPDSFSAEEMAVATRTSLTSLRYGRAISE